MEPGTSRKITTNTELPKSAGELQETLVEGGKGGDGYTIMLKLRGEDKDTAKEMKARCEDEAESSQAKDQIKSGEEEFNVKQEEELDPRIQVC